MISLRSRALAACVVLALGVPVGVARADDVSLSLGDAYVRIEGSRLTMGTSRASRVWLLEGTVPTIEFDGESLPFDVERSPDAWDEFTVFQGDVALRATLLRVETSVEADHLRASMSLEVLPGVMAERTYRAYPEARALYATTRMVSLGPAFTFDGYTVQSVPLPMDPSSSRAVAFNGGSDWRRDFVHEGPTPGTGELGYTTGQWQPFGTWVWMGRRGAAGSRIRRNEDFLFTLVDHRRDLANLGPIPPYRVDNPAPDDAGPRRRVLRPLASLVLEDSAAGSFDSADPFRESSSIPPRLAVGAEVARMLSFVARPYRHDIVYNSWGTFGRNIDEASMLAEIDAAADAGAEVFVLDDGWQDVSGDWNLDPVKFPRGPAPLVEAARARGMRFGFWMSPLNFHPSSRTFATHPDWAAIPYAGAAAYPSDSGFGVWSIRNPSFRAYLTSVVERLIAAGSSYFKLDFMVWVDDLNPANPGDYYDSHDDFLAWYDDLARRHPDVTFQLDETNDNRLFAFESVLRGPSWFRNGGPRADEKLANIAQLSPFVPARTLGQNLLARGTFDPSLNVDQEMASGLLGHPTFWTRMTTLPADVRARVLAWTDLYRAERALFAAPVVYPSAGAGWTVVQTYDPESDSALVASFGLTAPSPATQDVYGLRSDRWYRVDRLAPGAAPAPVGWFTGEQLHIGRALELRTAVGAVDLLRIVPA